jgi:hypothetical protein
MGRAVIMVRRFEEGIIMPDIVALLVWRSGTARGLAGGLSFCNVAESRLTGG